MTTTGRMLGLMLVLAVPSAFAEKAVKDDGGSVGKESSGGSSSGGSSSGSSGASKSSSSGSGSNSSAGNSGSSSSSSSHAQSDAERRSPRPIDTRGDRDGRDGHSNSYYSSGGRRVLYGHYGPHYHGSIYVAHSCYDPYWDYPYRYRTYNSYDPTGAVRVLVDPNKTKVFVDGYYAGIADDFDGLFQRLYLPPGRHEIELKLEGYKSHRVQIYSARGHVIKLHHDMVAGSGEDEPEDMAGAVGDDDEDMQVARHAEQDEEEDAPPAQRKTRLGSLHLSVSPKDASVYVDGEFWGSGIDDDLRLPAGRHEIAVVRPGFRSFEKQVEIRAGDTVELEVDLRKSL